MIEIKLLSTGSRRDLRTPPIPVDSRFDEEPKDITLDPKETAPGEETVPVEEEDGIEKSNKPKRNFVLLGVPGWNSFRQS